MWYWWINSFTKHQEMRIHVINFANGVDSDEAAHNEPPHLDLHCLLSGFLIFIMI